MIHYIKTFVAYHFGLKPMKYTIKKRFWGKWIVVVDYRKEVFAGDHLSMDFEEATETAKYYNEELANI